MPISNLTNVPKSFLKLGQIRKGAKVLKKITGKDGVVYEKELPFDLDHFRVTFLKNIVVGLVQLNIGEILEKRFREVYGDKPTALNVRFADHDVASVWDANYECYKQGGLVNKAGSTEARGLYWIFYRDPETMEVLISDERPRNAKGAALLEKPIDLNTPIYKNKKGDPFFLEPVGRLKVVIPELADIAVGYFEFRPESPRDIRNISAELGAIDAVAKSYGRSIAGVPFVLRRREEDVTKRLEGKLVADKSFVVHLDVTGEWGNRALSVLERLALPEIIEDEIVDALDVENNEPAAEPEQPALDPEAVYKEAAEIVVTVKGGKQKQIGELTAEQLTYIVEHGKHSVQIEAAKIVLQHDFQIEPA